MSKFALEALVAIVQRETSMINAYIAEYGELQFDPVTPAYRELCGRHERTKEEL